MEVVAVYPSLTEKKTVSVEAQLNFGNLKVDELIYANFHKINLNCIILALKKQTCL